MASNHSPTSGTSQAGKLPLLAFVGDDADHAALNEFAAGHEWAEGSVHKGDIRTATEFLKTNASPILLVVEIPSAAEAPALLDALAGVCDPDTKVIVTGAVNEYSFYCWLMELGIVSYLLKPLTVQVLEQSYVKSITPAAGIAPQEKQPARIIAVLGARGGVGASTIALNLAAILADSGKLHVALTDLDPHGGSIALALDIEPSRGLRDALEKPDRIDSLFIERVMTKPIKNLSVLSAEESLQDQLTIHDQAADMLLKGLRETFDVVVLDLPRHLSPFARQCLKQAGQVLVVTDLGLLSLRDTLRISDLLRDHMKMPVPIVVANRVGLAVKHEVSGSDFEKGINAKLAARIAFTPDLWMPSGSDIAALKHKQNAAMKPLYTLASQLVPEAKLKSESKAKASFGLFHKKKPQ